MTLRILPLISACLLTALAVCVAAEEKLYDHATLLEWEHRIGEIHPASEHSAVYVPGLTEIIADPDVTWVTRRRAAMTLARIGKPAQSAVPVLIRLLDEQGAEAERTHAWAGRALSLFGPLAAPAAPVFAERALDESRSPAERQMCIAALSGIGGSHVDVAPTLVKLLQYRPSPGANASDADAATLRQLAAEALTLTGREGVVALPILIRVTRDRQENALVRRDAIRALGALRGEAEIAIQPLLEALVLDEDESVRDAAAEALGSIGPPGVGVLQQYLQHDDAGVRWRAARALARIRPPSAGTIRALAQAAGDDDELVSVSACESLRELRAERGLYVPPAIDHLLSEHRDVRVRAWRVLESAAPLAASEMQQLDAAGQHEDPSVRRFLAHVRRSLEIDE